MVSRYQTKEPVHCFMQQCAPTHPSHQHHGHHQHHPQHHHHPQHPAPPHHLNHHPHHPHHPAQHHHQSHHHHHHQPSPTGPPPSALHAPPPLPPQQPPQSQPTPQQQQQAQQQPQLGTFRIVTAAAAAAAAAAARPEVYLGNFQHQSGAGPSLRNHHSGPPNSIPPPHHVGALGGLGPGGGAGPQGGGGGGGGGGPAQAPTPPGASPHEMSKQGGGPPTPSPHMAGQPQIPGASGLSMSYNMANQQRPSGPQSPYYRGTNPPRLMTNGRNQVLPANGVGPMGYQHMQMSPSFSVVAQLGTQPPLYVSPQPMSWYGGQTRAAGTYQYPPATQPQVIFQPSLYPYPATHQPTSNSFYSLTHNLNIVRSGAAGVSTGGGGHGGTPPQQQALQQQSPVLQQQTVVGGAGGPGGGMPVGSGGGGPPAQVGLVSGVMGPVGVSGVVGMGGGVGGGQASVQTQAKPRKHAVPIVDPITGMNVVEEMIKNEENSGAASSSSPRSESSNQEENKKSQLIAEFAAKVAKVAASTSESETPTSQPQPSETSGGGTMPQISGAMNGPSENIYPIRSENVGTSQLGMNASSEPWKQTSDKERDPVTETGICDTVIQKTVVEPVTVTKPEPVKEEKPECVPTPLNVPEVQQPPTPVVSARGGGIRVPSPVAATVSTVVKQAPTPVVIAPSAVVEVPAMVPSVNLPSQAQPSKESTADHPVKHQVQLPKSMPAAPQKSAQTSISTAPKGSESMVTKKPLPTSREGSSERKKAHETVTKEKEKKEEKPFEQTVHIPIEEPLPQRPQMQANGEDSLDSKATQRLKQKKLHKNRELNRKGEEKAGTDMDAFDMDAQLQQQRQEAAAAAAAAASNCAVATPVSQRIETPTAPTTIEKAVNDVGKSRTITPQTSQVPTAPVKTSALPPTPKGAAATNENMLAHANSNSTAKLESHPQVPSSKPGIEKNCDNKMSSVEQFPVAPEPKSLGDATSPGDEVEKEVAVEKVTEDSVSEVSRVKLDAREENEESTKVEKDIAAVEKNDKQDDMVATKNSENTIVSAAVVPVEEKKPEVDLPSKMPPAPESDSGPAAPTPVIENVASEAAAGKSKLKNIYKDDQWSPVNPQGKKKYERDFLLGLQNDPQSMKKPENLPDIEIVLKDSTNRMHQRPVDLKTIGNITRSSQQDFAPIFVKSLNNRQPAAKRNSQQGKPKTPKIMHVTISWNEDVKLHEAENAWKPRTKVPKDAAGQRKETEDLYSAMRGILNKLTPQNFEKLVHQVLKLPIDTMEKLRGVIDLVFDKAVDEPNFSVAYAELCNYLNNQNIARQAQKSEDSNNDFRKILLKRCQTEFEKDKDAERGLSEKLKEIEKETSEERKKELRLIMEEDERRMRRKSVGVTRFIGELYKLGMINQSIMVTCIRELLDAGDEESLECLCKLLTTVGKVLEEALEKKSSSSNLGSFFARMKSIVHERKTSSRVRFMLQDAIDLRNSKWIPRRDESNPKKIEQIAMEAERETLEQSQLTAAYTGLPSRGSMSGIGNRKDDRGKSRGEDWHTVSSSKNSKISVDPHKLKVSQVETENMQFGSRFQTMKWSRGASGGGNALMGDRKQNNFQILTEPDITPQNRRGVVRHKEAQIYTKSGSTSAISGKSEERERAIEAVRKNTAGGPQTSLENSRLGAGPPSKTPSRDSSVVPEDNIRTSSSMNAEPSKAAAQMSSKKVEQCCKMILEDYMSSGDAQEAFGYLKSDLPPENYVNFLQYSLDSVLLMTSPQRQSFGHLLVYLISNQLFQRQLFVEVLNKILSEVEDILLDIPKFWDYIADILAVLFEKEALQLSALKDLTSQLIKSNLSGPFIVAVMKLLFKDKGPDWISEKWAESSLQWSDVMAPENVEKFVKDNKLGYIKVGSSHAGFSKSAAMSGPIPMEEVKRKLDEILQSKTQSHDQVFAWINANVRERTKDPRFIRILTTAVIENTLDSNSKIKEVALTNDLRLLHKYINNIEEHELQALYAIQALVNKLEHPKGLMLKIFETMLNDDVISQDSFRVWEKSPDEPDGKAVALKSLTQFFTYLSETDELDSNEEG